MAIIRKDCIQQTNISSIAFNQTRNQIIFTNFRLIWIKTEFRLIPNQSENGNAILLLVLFNNLFRKDSSVCTVKTKKKIHKKFVILTSEVKNMPQYKTAYF